MIPMAAQTVENKREKDKRKDYILIDLYIFPHFFAVCTNANASAAKLNVLFLASDDARVQMHEVTLIQRDAQRGTLLKDALKHKRHSKRHSRRHSKRRSKREADSKREGRLKETLKETLT